MTDEAPRTAAAIAANVQRRIDRHVEELRARGYVVVSPEDLAKIPDRTDYGTVMLEVDVPAGETRHNFGGA